MRRILFLFIIGLFFSLNIIAQGKITSFKGVIKKGEKYGVKLVVEPETFQPGKAEYNEKNGVHIVLICYTYKGKKMALRLDMTSDIKNNGYFETFLLFGNNDKVSDVQNLTTTFFNAKEVPEENWPKKGDCF